MTPDDKTLVHFQTRVRQMLLRFEQMKKENADLRAAVVAKERQIEELEGKLRRKSDDYDTLKMMKMVEVSDDDIERTKNRLAALIRDVNKCIAILSEQK